MPVKNIKKENLKAGSIYKESGAKAKFRVRKTSFVVVFALLVFSFLLAFTFFSITDSPENIFAQTSSQESDTGYDFVLVIDESGSMKKNDPQNLRIDAAKLFIYLAEILNKGNRALVAGFGEITNVYAPLTDISGNEKELSSAIDRIKSSQDLTDMKGALTKIKEILDNRVEKRKTIVIFLTDGSLTLEDIPPETEEGKTTDTERKPGRTPGDSDGDAPDDGPLDTGASVNEKSNSESDSGAVKTPGGYLEQYKKELLDLCFKYKYDGVVITPIAFTKESEIGLLEQMAFITGGVCLKPEKASDLRNSFLDILKNITSRFIRSEDQIDSSPIAGEIMMDDYIKEAVCISLKNSFNENPGLSLKDPGNKTGIYDEYIEEKIFKIAKIKEPLAGKWEYEINGDSIFIFDIIDSRPLQPEFAIYTLDAEIPLEMKILSPEGGDFKDISGDLKISAAVADPNGKITENIELVDSGAGKDSKQSDGIFSGSYSGSGISGYHNVSLIVQHIPTQSQSSKSMSYEVIKLPVKVTLLEPSGDFYGLNKEITIRVRVEQAGTSEISDRPFNLADYYISYNMTNPQGQVSRELALIDNGKVPDTEAGDGIYSGIFSTTSREGDYRIDYFITDITKMLEPACTGLKSSFTTGQVPGLVIKVENNLFAGGKTVVSANLEDYSAAELEYELKKPDGTTAVGMLSDNGDAASGDAAANDKIYTATLADLAQLGRYELVIDGTFKSGDMAIPVTAETGFNKDFDITGFTENPAFDSQTGTLKLSFRLISKSSADAELSVNGSLLDRKIIKSADFISGNRIGANTESYIEMTVELAEDLASGDHEISVPVIVSSSGQTSEKNLFFKVSVPEEFPPYLFIIVIVAGIVVVAGIVLFVYFLFIRPKKRVM